MTAPRVDSTLLPRNPGHMLDLRWTSGFTAQRTVTARCMQMHARMGLLEGYLPTTSKGQPWVPATGKAFLDGTAAADIDDAVMGRAWSSWEVALVRRPQRHSDAITPAKTCQTDHTSPETTDDYDQCSVHALRG